MKNQTFYALIIALCVIGILSTGLLVKHTLDLSKDLSITAYIANEE